MAQLHALVIDDIDLHAFIAETHLRQSGFVVTTAPSLMVGIEQAYTLLDPSHPPHPTLILIDLMLPHERCPVLEGIAGAAHLIEQMEQQLLHPAHIVAITGEPTEQRRRESLAAGCHMLLQKPFTQQHAHDLARLVREELPALPTADSTDDSVALRNTLRRDAAQILYFMRSVSTENPGRTVTWEADEVRKLLFRPQALDMPWMEWIRGQGGIEQVRTRLSAVWLPTAEHRAVRDKVMVHGQDWQASTGQLHMSRSTYFRYLGEVMIVLAETLNSWSPS